LLDLTYAFLQSCPTSTGAYAVSEASHDEANDKACWCIKFEKLQETQHPASVTDNRWIVINVSDVPLEDAAYSALSKGLNYAVDAAVLLIEDFHRGAEKSVGSLPEEGA
jgi:hypothetical protein